MDIKTEDIVFDKSGIMWFFSYSFNGLFKKSGNQVTYVGSVPWEEILGNRLYGDIELVDNRIFLIPFKASQIAIYDISNNSFSAVSIGGELNKNAPKFYSAIVYEKEIYMFGVLEEIIAVLDTNSDQVNYISDWRNRGVGRTNALDPFFYSKPFALEGKLYAFYANKDAVLKLDIDSKTAKSIVIGDSGEGHVGQYYENGKLYAIPRHIGHKAITYEVENECIVKDKEPFLAGVEGYFISLEKIDGKKIFVSSNETGTESFAEGLVINNALFAKTTQGKLYYYNKKEKALFHDGTKQELSANDFELTQYVCQKAVIEDDHTDLELFIDIIRAL